MNINWFPGHMAKTRGLIKENLKLVDVVIELIDARIPRSSRNPEIDTLIGSKPRLIVMNKSDLSDNSINNQWKKWYNENGYTCIFIDSKTGSGLSSVKSELLKMTKAKVDAQAEKGRMRSIRTMVVGIPNVGKSTLINKLAGKAVAMTGDRPGVTKSKQWVRLDEKIELLDMPGVLWPKFDDETVGLNLAFTGAIKDDILDIEEIAYKLVGILKDEYPQQLGSRYKVEPGNYLDTASLFEQIGKNRGCIVSGGKVDYKRISAILLDEFRAGKIGRISLEKPHSEV